MASARERRYWDSFCFIAVLNNEEPYASTHKAYRSRTKRKHRGRSPGATCVQACPDQP